MYSKVFVYESGISVKQDYQTALNLYKKACAGNEEMGCFSLALMYELGNGVKKDPAFMENIIKKACEASEMSDACSLMGPLAHVKLYEKLCDFGNPNGCTTLGLVFYSAEEPVKDVEKAMKLFRKACDMGGMNGCSYLGTLYIANDDADEESNKITLIPHQHHLA